MTFHHHHHHPVLSGPDPGVVGAKRPNLEPLPEPFPRRVPLLECSFPTHRNLPRSFVNRFRKGTRETELRLSLEVATGSDARACTS